MLRGAELGLGVELGLGLERGGGRGRVGIGVGVFRSQKKSRLSMPLVPGATFITEQMLCPGQMAPTHSGPLKCCSRSFASKRAHRRKDGEAR